MSSLCAQNISIDHTYGVNGYVTGATNGRFVNVAAILPNNEVLVAGNPGSNNSYYVEKYLDDGTRDTTFGNNGLILVNIVANSKDNANSMIIQPDGKILIAGTSDSNPSLFGIYWDTFVSRLMPDGSLDTTFGTNGHVKTDLGTNDDEVWDVAFNNSGEIYVLAATQSPAVDSKLLKYDANGALDTTFGTSGILDVPFPVDSRVYELKINNADELIIGGTVLNSITGEYEVQVIKLDAQGALVSSFGTAGVTTITDPLENFTVRDIIFTSDGGLLLLGAAGNNSINTQLALYKLTATGAIDTTFNNTGYGYYDHNSSSYGVTFGYTVVQLPDDSYIAQADIIGNNNYDLLLLNIGANGTLVNNFANSGHFILPRSTHQDYNRQVLLQDDGKLIVTGMATDNTTRRTMLVRFKDAFTLSNDDINNATSAVYPNPFTDSILIEHTFEIQRLTLFNALGQQVQEVYHSNNMNTSNLHSGVYFLKIENKNGYIMSHQLIKE